MTDESPESLAREIGWVPKEEFRGSADKWVDAQTFLDRGQSYIPFLKKTNSQQAGKIAQLEAAVAASHEAIGELRKASGTAQRERLQNEIVDLRRQLAEARRAGDVDQEVELETQLDQKRDAVRAVEAPKAPVAPQPQAEDPEVTRFKETTPWWNTRPDMQRAAAMMANVLPTRPDYAAMSPRERFNLLRREVERQFGINPEPPAPPDKVESARNPGSGATPGARTYANLPAEAKAIVERQAKQLVGPNSWQFKDLKSWQDYYAENFDWRE